MNEVFKGILIIACVLIVGFFLGVFAGRYGASKEIKKVENNLSDAIAANETARERLTEYESEIAALERTAKERQRTIQSLRGTVSKLRGSARERQETIDALEKSIGRSGDATGKIAELAREGREIVEELLKSNMARPP